MQKLIVYGFDSGLNEVLAGRMYDFRTKKYRNPVKAKNDAICCKAIRANKLYQIDKPILIRYTFYCKDKRRDKMNIFSAFDKSFEDALQTCKIIKNDGWTDIVNTEHYFHVDKSNPRVVVEIIEVEK